MSVLQIVAPQRFLDGAVFGIFLMMLSGMALYMFGEFHNWNINLPADKQTGRGGLHLRSKFNESISSLRHMVKLFHSYKDCKTWIEEKDDEAYLHDGIPFPTPYVGMAPP